MEEEAKKEEIRVYPLSKGKRFVAFLADFFLTSIISFALFHLAFYPLISYCANLYQEQETCQQAQKERDGVLYGNSLLFYEEGKSDKEPTSFTANLEYTCKAYVSSLIKGDSIYDIFRHYFVDIRSEESFFADWIKEQDKAAKFFDYSPVALSSAYIEEFSPIFEEGNAPSKKGEEDYEKFQKQFFLPSYSAMLNEIQKNDLSFNETSYNQKQEVVTSFAKKANAVVISSVLSSYAVSTLAVFLFSPLISKTRKTIGMIFLRRERVNAFKLMPLRKRDLVLPLLYAFFANGVLLFLLPWPIVSFNELFSIPVLWILSSISLLFDIVSLIFFLFDPLDRTLIDKLTSSVMLDEDNMAEIYKAKGYKY